MSTSRRAVRATTNVMVTVDESHRDQLDVVTHHLASAGLAVSDKFALGGVIVGEIATVDLAKLRRIAGVKTIEEEPTFTAEG